MKYEVIGWIDPDMDDYPTHEVNTPPVRAAIDKEIREHGYLFGGNSHDYIMPLLNDGTCVDYSWRGWGGVMAEAWGEKGDYAYMFAYMDSLLDPAKIKYPKTGNIDESRIVPRAAITETFVMHLVGVMFDKLGAGTKSVEVRLFDEKRKRIDIGDLIEFRKSGSEEDFVLKRVADMYVESSFQKIFEEKAFNENSDWVRRFSPEQFGFPKGCKTKDFVKGMRKYYDESKEKEYGAIAFVLEQPNACRTEFSVSTDDEECYELYDKMLIDAGTDGGAVERVLEEAMDGRLVDEVLQAISENFERRNWEDHRIGLNTAYNADVNVMLRETLKELFGKEEELKAIRDRYCAALTLHIEATIARDSDEPRQNLSLDKDIIEFLHKSGAKLDFRYNVVGKTERED